MSPMTNALITYWHRLPAHSPAERRQHLTLTCDGVRTGHLPPQALVPFALGDVDDEIVRQATLGYIEAGMELDADDPRLCAEDACEWIRRDLVLNRGAVFAALLETGDATVLQRLASHRLVLTVETVATICRLLPDLPGRAALRFLSEWVELLEGTGDLALRRQRDLISAAFEARSPDVATRAAA
jgi:hypothetical protein